LGKNVTGSFEKSHLDERVIEQENEKIVRMEMNANKRETCILCGLHSNFQNILI